MDRRLYTMKDVAEYLSVSTSTVRRMSERGDLPKPISIGGVRRWDKAQLDRYLDELGGNREGYDDPDIALMRHG